MIKLKYYQKILIMQLHQSFNKTRQSSQEMKVRYNGYRKNLGSLKYLL